MLLLIESDFIPESHSRRKAGQMEVECGGLDFLLSLSPSIHSSWALTDKQTRLQRELKEQEVEELSILKTCIISLRISRSCKNGPLGLL